MSPHPPPTSYQHLPPLHPLNTLTKPHQTSPAHSCSTCKPSPSCHTRANISQR
ncbi:hypothetical protein BU26DRAFT_512852 [Trematosphaeria pertusa]|uniref:Uncharacterized protein n=1 Tax=Trematosphaeria pertusa TaxID=390896 RepID=A0A6A6IZV6_9PLEO|nr:uncharacterized protein BU26DRAFT_512852 [Trematosphaeria pertusa]KAF2255906.1 hypothetical protein BU26DRAFT_512852 [Trematosphaeria pertusa]